MIDFSTPKPTHLCANPDCYEREWSLEPLGPQLWRLHAGPYVFTMAWSELDCPLCSAPLLEIAAIELGLETKPPSKFLS